MNDGLDELKILAGYLADCEIGVTTGKSKSIFVNHMPAPVEKGVLIRQDYLGIQIDHYLPGYYKTSFQLIVRDADLAAGADLAARASAALTMAETAIGAMKVKYLRPRHKPIAYPASQGDRFECLVNVDACYLLI